MKKFTSFFTAIVISLASMGTALASFTDVSSTHPNYEAINYVQSKTIVDGYPGGTYAPDKLIDRYEFTKIIVGATFSKEEIMACKTSPFKDVPMDWFTPYVCKAQKEGVIDGYPDGTFQGTNQIKIVEAAKIVVNAFKYPVQEDVVTWYKPYIQKLGELNALPTNITGFDYKVSRGDMAEIIYRLMEKITTKGSTTYNELTGEVFEGNYTTAQITEMATDYHNFLIDKENVAIDKYEAYTTLADNTDLDGDFTALEKERVKITQEIKAIQLQIAGMASFRNDSSLKDAVVKDLQDLIDVLNTEEKQLIELWVKMSKVNGDVPQSYLDEQDDLFDAINEKAENASEAFNLVQQAFADEYGFSLEENARTDQDKVIAYNNDVVAFQTEAFDIREAYIALADATSLEDGDFTALDKKREEAIKQIQALEKELKAMEGYNGDVTLRDAFVVNIQSIIGTLEVEEQQLIDIWIQMSADPDNISQNLIDQENSVFETIEVKDDTAYEKLATTQEAFAKKYDYTIEQ